MTITTDVSLLSRRNRYEKTIKSGKDSAMWENRTSLEETEIARLIESSKNLDFIDFDLDQNDTSDQEPEYAFVITNENGEIDEGVIESVDDHFEDHENHDHENHMRRFHDHPHPGGNGDDHRGDIKKLFLRLIIIYLLAVACVVTVVIYNYCFKNMIRELAIEAIKCENHKTIHHTQGFIQLNDEGHFVTFIRGNDFCSTFCVIESDVRSLRKGSTTHIYHSQDLERCSLQKEDTYECSYKFNSTITLLCGVFFPLCFLLICKVLEAFYHHVAFGITR
jgi:hypothetical protein